MSLPTVRLRFLSGREVVLEGRTLRHLLRRLRSEVSAVPAPDRGYNFQLFDSRGNEVYVDAHLSDGAEYAVVVSEVHRSEVLVEIDESVEVMEWQCREFYNDICDCDMCLVRPMGKMCPACGMYRFTGNGSRCSDCLQDERNASIWRRLKNRDMGLCTVCSSPAEDNRVRCRPCRLKANAYQRTRYILKKAK